MGNKQVFLLYLLNMMVAHGKKNSPIIEKSHVKKQTVRKIEIKKPISITEKPINRKKKLKKSKKQSQKPNNIQSKSTEQLTNTKKKQIKKIDISHKPLNVTSQPITSKKIDIEKNTSSVVVEQDSLHSAIIEDSQYILNEVHDHRIEDEHSSPIVYVDDKEEMEDSDNKITTNEIIESDNVDEEENTYKEGDSMAGQQTSNQEEASPIVDLNNEKKITIDNMDREVEEEAIDDNNFYCIFLIDLIMNGQEVLLRKNKEELKLAIDDLYNSLATLTTVDTFFLFLFTLLKNHQYITIKNHKIYLNNLLLLEFVDKNIYYYDAEKERKYLLVFTENKYDLLQAFLSFFANVFQNPREDNIFYLLNDLFQEVNIKSFIKNKEKMQAVLPVNISNSDPNLEKNKYLRKKKGVSKQKNQKKTTKQKQVKKNIKKKK